MFMVATCLVSFLLLSPFTGASYYGKRLRQDDGTCAALQNESWSYSGDNGPEHWKETFPACNGSNQSPISLNFWNMRLSTLPKLEMNNYDKPITAATVMNNGHTIEVIPTDGVRRTIEAEGSEYELVQFHFHWGSQSDRGSEHLFLYQATAMELHLVHENAEGNLAVVGVLYKQMGSKENEGLKSVVEVLPDVQFKGQTTNINSNINLNDLVPENPASIFRYDGSLTTPECSEGVIWSVATKVPHVSETQMEVFRSMYATTKVDATGDECRLVDNFRPVQRLNGRKVLISAL